VREICDRHNVLLISDEVICAWGRLGYWFGCERYGYQPDLMTVAKAHTSAYVPMGGLIARTVLPSRSCRTTSRLPMGSPSPAIRSRCGGDGQPRRVRARGHLRPRARQGRASCERCSTRCATSRSLATCAAMVSSDAIELVKDQETKEGFTDDESEWLLRGYLSGELFRRGLICRADDRGDPVIQLAPPLICDTEQFEEIEDVLRPVLTEAWERLNK
jgi:adenosylmethionine-8-amino-7-oxononanoate aminotransferase